MMQVRELRQFRCQLVYLTVTLPSYMMALFSERSLLSSPVVIRGRTLQTDIQNEVVRCTSTDLLEESIVST